MARVPVKKFMESLWNSPWRKVEHKIDRFNHILELVRTIAGLVSATGTLIVLFKLFHLI